MEKTGAIAEIKPKFDKNQFQKAQSNFSPDEMIEE